MILYVDETENEEFFIVTGLLMPSKEDTMLVYKNFKNKIADYPIPAKFKAKLFDEFKSWKLDNDYPRVKIKMLETLNDIDYQIIYSTYNKRGKKVYKSEKEKIYINMLSSIVKHIDKNIDIFFDHTDFDDNIILKIKNVFSNVGLIEPKDSFVEKGIQIIDNLCSVVGRHETNCDIRNFYTLIEKHVKKVDINESKWYSNNRN